MNEAHPESLPHGGATRTSAFLRSEFCMSCHQFGADGYALNGKLLENTYEEWKASPAARRELQCQSCHMPDRRHLWRGVHDPQMVKSGVEISLVTDRSRYQPGEHLVATLTIASTNVGHYFPTYVTPRVVVRASLIDAGGRTVAGSVEEAAIGRDVTLDLSRELADTRVAPGGRFTFRYRRRLDRPVSGSRRASPCSRTISTRNSSRRCSRTAPERELRGSARRSRRRAGHPTPSSVWSSR